MISKFKNNEARKSAVIYRSNFEQVKELYEDDKEMAGELAISIMELVFILHSALQPYNHNIKIDDVYDLFDEYIADGHTYMDFINVVIELFKVSGVIRDEKDEGESPNA